eukprot:m.525268 g.525268  ORF g.525268 m.525268 type:complete len:322 (+) comp57542_c0_seq2:199-1164(+)
MPPKPYEVLYPSFFKPLLQVFKTGDVELRCAILDCCMKMVHRYATFNWTLHSEAQASVPKPEALVLSDGIAKADYFSVIQEMMLFTSSLASIALVTAPSSFQVQDTVLTYLETTNALSERHGLGLLLEPASFICPLHLSSNSLSFSRICGFLADCKHGNDRIKSFPPTERSMPIPNATAFNSFLMDIVFSIWHHRVVEDDGKTFNLTGYFFEADRERLQAWRTRFAHVALQAMPRALQLSRKRLQAAMSMTKGVFCGFAAQFLEGSDSALVYPESPQALAVLKDLTIQFVEFLRLRHLDGVSKFLYTFITVLKDKQPGARV